MKRPRLNPRKLLIASAGVATVNYAFAAGCGGQGTKNADFVANLMPPVPGISRGTGRGTVANLVAPPPPIAGAGGTFSGVVGTVANLVAPPPPVVISPPALPQDAAVDANAPADADLDAG